MKYLVLTLFLSNLSYASGFTCSSKCVAQNFTTGQWVLLGSISNNASVEKSILFEVMQNQCKRRAKAWGLFSFQAALVRSIDFSTSQINEYTRVHTVYACSGAVVEQSFWRVLYQESFAKIDFDDANRACSPDDSIPAGTTPLIGKNSSISD